MTRRDLLSMRWMRYWVWVLSMTAHIVKITTLSGPRIS
jgi:hypothetical protein